jgi:nicotinate-nucleotide pyrophosphorylase (carboxylating)
LAESAAPGVPAVAALADLAADAARVAAVALAEDGPEDVTTALVAPGAGGAGGIAARGVIRFRGGGVLAGCAYADAVVRACGAGGIAWAAREGDAVPPGAAVGELRGALAELLRAERPLLNLLQRACGIATATRAFVDAVAGTGCRILHTRKTTPGLRGLEVRAVLAGGGAPHRVDLAHAVLIKDNHWRALARGGMSLAAVLAAARARGVTACYVEVESPAQLEAACAAGATRVLIDNQAPDTVREWARTARRLAPAIEIEATGGITLATVRRYAEAEADFVSVGALTHSARAADLALELG